MVRVEVVGIANVTTIFVKFKYPAYHFLDICFSHFVNNFRKKRKRKEKKGKKNVIDGFYFTISIFIRRLENYFLTYHFFHLSSSLGFEFRAINNLTRRQMARERLSRK